MSAVQWLRTSTDAGRRPTLIDAALAVCLAAISVLVATQAASRGEAGAGAPSSWWQWSIVVLPSAAVAFRRSAPLVATPVAVAAQMAIWALDLAQVFVAPLVMIYSVVLSGGPAGRRVGVASAVALSAMAAVGVVIAPDVDLAVFALTVLSSVAVLILGVNAANQQLAFGELAAELAVAELEEDVTRERAVVRERERIARELHDLVGHSLSMIAVRSEAAQRVGTERPDVAWQAIEAIGESARESLTEVRRVLHAVHDDEAELSPRRSLADLRSLVERVASSGVDVDLRMGAATETESVDPAVGAGIYRIVQESLTNVIKHAGESASAEVTVDIDDEMVVLTVIDDGRGPRTEQEGPGSGIAGMSERARFLGGTLVVAPPPGGGFGVRAAIPAAGPT